MNRNDRYAARIAFHLPQSLYDKLEKWAEEEDRPLANLVYTMVKQAVAGREHAIEHVQVQREMKS
jgi:hypothetical protein